MSVLEDESTVKYSSRITRREQSRTNMQIVYLCYSVCVNFLSVDDIRNRSKQNLSVRVLRTSTIRLEMWKEFVETGKITNLA